MILRHWKMSGKQRKMTFDLYLSKMTRNLSMLNAPMLESKVSSV